MSQRFTCTVNLVGPSVDGSETPIASDLYQFNGFREELASWHWFFAANLCKRELLAVALASISTQSQVWAYVDPPPPPPSPAPPDPKIILKQAGVITRKRW